MTGIKTSVINDNDEDDDDDDFNAWVEKEEVMRFLFRKIYALEILP